MLRITAPLECGSLMPLSMCVGDLLGYPEPRHSLSDSNELSGPEHWDSEKINHRDREDTENSQRKSMKR